MSVLVVVALAALWGTAEGYEIWVTNQGKEHHKVQIIDSSTWTVVAEIPSGRNPHNVTFSRDFSRAYVANVGTGDVSVIDTKARTVMAAIPTGKRAHGVAVSPDGRWLYVANVGDNNVSVVDLSTHAVVKTIPAGKGAALPAFSPDGTRAYVSNGADATITVIDVTRHEAVDVIKNAGRGAMGTVVTRDGRVIVTGGEDNEFSVIDLRANKHRKFTVGKEPHGVAVTPDGKFAWIPNRQSMDVTILDVATEQVVGRVEIGDKADIVDFAPDGSRAFVTLRGSAMAGAVHAVAGQKGAVAVVNVADRKVERIIDVGGDPHGIGVKP